MAQGLGRVTSFSALVERSARALRWRPFLAVLPVLGAVLALSRQFTHGFVLSEDSVIYISWTRNLLQGAGFAPWDGAAYDNVNFAPGYSWLLALASGGWWDPLAVAGPLNAALHGATVFIVIRWLRHRIASRFWAGWGSCVVAFAAPLVTLTSGILSDSAFVLWTTLALLAFDRFLQDGTDAALLRAAAFAGVAGLTRYAGIPLLVVLMAGLSLRLGGGLGVRLRRVAAFALVALAPIGAWMYRNYVVTGAFTQLGLDPAPQSHALAETIPATLQGLAAVALAPAKAGEGWVGALILIVLVAASVRLWRPGRGTGSGDGIALVYVAFIGAYLGMIAIVTRGSLLDFWPGSFRYLVPVYVPVVLTLVLALDRMRPWGRRDRIGALSLLLKILLAAWAVAGILASLRANVAAPPPRNLAASPAMRYMQAHFASGRIFSNLPRHAYIQADAQTQHRPLPGPGLDALERELALQSRLPGHAYVIFFHDDPMRYERYYLYRLPATDLRAARRARFSFRLRLAGAAYAFSAADLRAQAELEPLAELADGAVFRIKPALAGRAEQIRTDFDRRLRALTAGAPVAQSVFHSYLADGALHLVKEPCRPDDTELKFFLHVAPLRRRDLPSPRQPFGFDNRDFHFSRYGLRLRDRCLATVPLPTYGLEDIRVGQFEGLSHATARQAWQDVLPVPDLSPAIAQALRAEWAAATAGAPVARALFDVYVTADAVRFAKTPCRPEDVQPKFVLHAVPVRRWNWPWRPRALDFDNLDFAFKEQGGIHFEGQCWVSVDLPAYAVAQLRVGQFDSERQRDVWQEIIPMRAEKAAPRPRSGDPFSS